ncbi:MAG: sugar transferase [Rhodococcus sp. (in: high G+C Gram-positive bacteria)]|uniref:sugar transferase n=1 Tax=Rhodococcus sp. EPR-157 TaxID=1813677 RepID=UPI000AD2163D|nr:sugar transferase [Rhodococcus sp. EPR-157]
MSSERVDRSDDESSHSAAATVALSSWDAGVKSIFDKIVSTGMLVVLAPILLLCWAYVKSANPGKPAIVKLPRIGFGGRRFEVLNFRSAPGHPMITYGLVHLPELINVLRGEMSLVGPRPRPFDDTRVGTLDTPASVRVELHPGMTGLWILTPRTELTPQDIFSLDRSYLESWSLSRDIHILFAAARKVRYGRETV